MAEEIKNFTRTELAESIDDTQTTFDVVDGEAFPAEGYFRFRVDDEFMAMYTRTGNTLDEVDRGIEDSVAVSHASGAVAKGVLTAAGLVNNIEQRVSVIVREEDGEVVTTRTLWFTKGTLVYLEDDLSAYVRDVAVGDTFPADPLTGIGYFRTDIRGGMLFRYDGTRWLSDQVFEAESSVNGVTADYSDYQAMPADYDIYVTQCHTSVYVSGSATWVLSAQYSDFDNSIVNVSSQSTAGQTAGKMYHYTNAVGAVLDTDGGNSGSAPTAWFFFFDEQSGSASLWGSIQVEYRLIAS